MIDWLMDKNNNKNINNNNKCNNEKRDNNKNNEIMGPKQRTAVPRIITNNIQERKTMVFGFIEERTND